MTKEKKILNRFDGSFWNSRYNSGQTGWDIGEVSTPIKAYIDQLSDKSLSILIPGCGNAYEAEYISSAGFNNITVIDISDVLTRDLEKKFEGNSSISVVNKDFFEHDGKYDLIIEQTFFCAIDPSMRVNYVEKSRELLSEKGKLVGVLFDKDFEKEGPPFGGSQEEYREIFSKHFHIDVLEKCRNSIIPRSGGEVFINFKPKK
jgi:SAM-dependent methyltransferase